MKAPEETKERYGGDSVHVSKRPDETGLSAPISDAAGHFGRVHSEDEQERSCERLLELNKQATLAARQANEGLLKKIGRLELTEKELLESNERLRSILESAHDPIVGADSRGRIIRWNPAAVQTFGYTEEEVLNQPVTILMPDRFAALHEAAMQRAVASGSLYYSKRVREVAGRRKDGTEFPVEVSISAWKTQEGMFFTAIIRNITERKQREQELRKAYAELEFRVEERTAELVKLNADLKQEIKDREHAEEMLRRSEQLYHVLVEEVPDVIFVLDNAGRFIYLNIQAEKVLGRDLRDILETSITSYVVPEERVKILSILDLSPDAIWDEEVRLLDVGDETKYARIRCKALVQADEGKTYFEGVMRDISRRKRLEEQLRESREQLLEKIRIIDELYAHIVESGKALETAELESEGYFEMKVQNHGLVIKEEDLQRIFSPFHAVNDYGAGIGLTVSKKIVEAHNGSISVHSDERGTTFTVWLPLAPRQAGLERLAK